MNTKSLLEQIFSDENINLAIGHLNNKKNSCTNDGVWLHDLDKYWKVNKEIICGQIYAQKYYPNIVQEYPIITKNRKHRTIAKFSSVDRLLLRAIQQILNPIFDQLYSSNSYAYRNNFGVEQAIARTVDMIASGKEYIVNIDIKDFFDSIPHAGILFLLKQQINDESLLSLLEKYLMCTIQDEFKLYQKSCGLIQGNPLSPLFSNLYLTEFDFFMESLDIPFIRFADDIFIFVEDVNQGSLLYEQTVAKLHTYSLNVNAEKSGIYSVYTKTILGYNFEKSRGNIIVKKHNWKAVSTYPMWHTSALQKRNNDYVIIDDGILTRRDFSILFENPNKKINIPCETTNSINVFSNIEFSANFFETLKRHGITMNIYDKFGNAIGSFTPAKKYSQMHVLIKQVEIYNTPKKRLYYAKRMEIAALHNLMCNLKYYNKRHFSDLLQKTISDISKNVCELKKHDRIDSILLLEAQVRRKYYLCFNEILNAPEFYFLKRSRRPPTDPINALISFGNSVLYQKISQIIHRTSVDIRISFVHSAMKRYENLNLDIADIFKPILVDRTIFTLINKHMLSTEKHFHFQEDGSVLLNTDGKKIFLYEFEKKVNQKITLENKAYTYEELIYRDIKKLEQSLLTDSSYKPFKYKM